MSISRYTPWSLHSQLMTLNDLKTLCSQACLRLGCFVVAWGIMVRIDQRSPQTAMPTAAFESIFNNQDIIPRSRHRIRQLRTGWLDRPAYITKCPIQSEENCVYNFTVTGKRGSLLWHSHTLWLRATVSYRPR